MMKVHLPYILILQCWNRLGHVVPQSQRQRVDLEEPEPEKEFIYKVIKSKF